MNKEWINDRQAIYMHYRSNNFLVFIPGASGNVQSERYRFIDEIAAKSDYSLVKYEFLWQIENNQDAYTLNDCQREIEEVLGYIKKNHNAYRIVFIAKSLGSLIVELLREVVDGYILLSPLLRERDMQRVMDKPLSSVSAEEIGIRYEDLKDKPTLIFIGTRDKLIDHEYIEKIKPKRNHRIVLIKDGGHSLKSMEAINKIKSESLRFLKEINL